MGIFSPAGSSTIGIYSLPTTVTAPVIQNVSVALANTEYVIVIPANTKRFQLYSRSLGSMRVAYVSGETATNYLTVDYGNVYSEGDLALVGNLTIYFQSNKASDIIEVLTWS